MTLPARPVLLRPARTVLAGLAAAALAACGGGGGNSDDDDDGSAPAVEVAAGFSTPKTAKSYTSDGRTRVAAGGEIVVLLREDVTRAEYDAVLEALRDRGVTRAGFLQSVRALQVSLPAGEDELATATAIAALPGVRYAGLNELVETVRANPPRTTPMPPVASRERPLAIDPEGEWWRTAINLSVARGVEDDLDIATGPLVAVVDTGLLPSQTYIDAARVTRVDERGQSITGDIGSSFGRGHGTSVAAFALGDSADASGVSRHARLLSVDVPDVCSAGDDDWLGLIGCRVGFGRMFGTELLTGLDTAIASDARIVNASWGDTSPCNAAPAVQRQAHTAWRQSVANVVAAARQRDKLVVLSAGNNCDKRDDQLLPDPDDPIADAWKTHALVVGASTEEGKDALFSRMGQTITLLAPGEAVGFGAGAISGTSFAAPIVAGTAALVQGIAPGLSAAETRHLLVSGAESSISFADAKAAGYEGYTGENATGPNLLLNAGNAAEAARLARDAEFQSLPSVDLARGATREVTFDVTVPETGVKAVDIVFVVDTSGSYGDDIATLKRQASDIIDDLTGRGLDVQFAVTEFSDFPLSSYGVTGDVAFARLSRMSPDKAVAQAGIDALELKFGSDTPESQLEALYQVATGSGRDLDGDGIYEAEEGDIPPQAVGFRPGAARVVLFATDAPFHDSDTDDGYPGAGFAAATAALRGQGIQVIALQSGTTSTATADLERLVDAVGGSIFQLDSDSGEIGAAIAEGIDDAFAEVTLSAEPIALAEWVRSIEPASVNAVKPGETVTFTATLQGQRDFSITALDYEAWFWVRANGSALLKRVQQPIAVAR